MSAYLVSDKSMSVIARSLEYYAILKPRFSGHNTIYKTLDSYHKHYLIQSMYGEKETIAEKIFQKLIEVNLLSLQMRYENIEDNENAAQTYKYDKNAPVVSIPVLIDLLNNWQYQACEGSASETDFYKLTEALQDKLARKFVEMSRSEDQTVWGIHDYSELDKIEGAYAY